MYHTWRKGPLGLDIAPHGKDNHDKKGIMITKTPGPPFPSTVTAGMLIDGVNGKSIAKLSFLDALAVIKEIGEPKPNPNSPFDADGLCR